MATTAVMPAADSAVKRLNINLSETAFSELQTLSKQTQRSMTDIVRLGLGLVKIAIQEAAKGNKLIVTTTAGDALKEIVLPG